MIHILDGQMTVCHNGRSVAIQRITDESYYQALKIYGARDSVAQAAAKGLITVKTGAK